MKSRVAPPPARKPLPPAAHSVLAAVCLALSMPTLLAGHAQAQASTGNPTTTAKPPRSITKPASPPNPPKRAPTLRGLSGAGRAASGGAQQVKAPAPPPATGQSGATTSTPAAPIPGGPEIKPFETGIDYKPTSPRTRVTFNLEDAELPDLVRLISQITGKRFILPGKSRSIKATVYAPTKVTAAEAYQAFLSILEINGMALVPAGRYLKIVESGRVEGRPIPLYEDQQGTPGGDRFITRLHRVNHIAAEDAATLLERFKSGDGSLTAYAPSNMLIITDTGTNIRRMVRILGVVDVARTGEQIWVEPVHHADAGELATRLTEIFEVSAEPAKKAAPKRAKRTKGKAATAGATGSATVGSHGESRLTKIIADERTNSLIIVATENAYLRILEMLKHLDVSMEGEGRIHVHRLQHSDAEELAGTLSSLAGGKGAAPRAKGKAGPAQASIFEGKVAITAHKAANALVITSSTHDYAAIRHVIDRLDQPRKQVFIETVIMELDVTRSSSLGFAYHTGVPDFPTNDSLTAVGFEAKKTIFGLGSGDLLTGLAVGVQGPEVEGASSQFGLSLPSFGVAIQAMAGNSNANVLSTPHLIAMDNVEAEISVGGNVPLQNNVNSFGGGNIANLLGQQGGSNAQNALGGINPAMLGGLGGFGGSVPRQDIGTTVTLTPHINQTDEIRLEIAEEISDAGPPSQQGGLGVRSINRTKAKTEVVVRDQQTVVIGGLMRDSINNRASKIPVLGDIPLLGALFRNSSKEKVKKNLLLFLTPYIIRSPSDLRAIYERKMRERQEFLDRYFVFEGHDFEPAVDYSRTRGLISEVLRELVELDEERMLAQEMAARPVPVHEPRPAVGLAQGGEGGQGDDDDEGAGEALEEGDVVIEQPASGDSPDPSDAPAPAEPDAQEAD